MAQLTPHFTTEEFEYSRKAKELGIRNKMPQIHAVNAFDLCQHVLEHVREHFGRPVTITSGYRSAGLNEAVHGEATSQHCFGKAADIVVAGVETIEVFRWIVRNLPFDQCIYEISSWDDGRVSIWVHVSYNGKKNRRQCLKGVRHNGGKTIYTPFKG